MRCRPWRTGGTTPILKRDFAVETLTTRAAQTCRAALAPYGRCETGECGLHRTRGTHEQ